MRYPRAENERHTIIKEYNEALIKCMEILNSVDKKYGTYGVVEARDIDVTEFGGIFHTYIRALEWREIRLQ